MINCGTVEIQHASIVQQIDLIKRAFCKLKRCSIFVFPNQITKLQFKQADLLLSYVENNYETEVAPALVQYYSGEYLQNKACDLYNMHLASNNFTGKLSQCLSFIKIILEYLVSLNTNDFAEVIAVFTYTVNMLQLSKITTNVKKIDYEKCACGGEMKIFPTSSELICSSCGCVMILYGTVFEDTQFYNQEGQRSKHGSYEPSRHCKFWVCRIQAEGSTEIPVKCIDQIVECIRRDGIFDRRKLMCARVREYLKEIKCTDYNDYVPLIRKIITGIVPPQLTRDETRQLHNIFDKCVNEYENVKPISKRNKMYYPYIIYKILDHIITKNGIRKKRILECIHLQSRDTLITNDNIWEKICENIDGVDYKPTDKNDQKIYL
jgi:hypothetical protein